MGTIAKQTDDGRAPTAIRSVHVQNKEWGSLKRDPQWNQATSKKVDHASRRNHGEIDEREDSIAISNSYGPSVPQRQRCGKHPANSVDTRWGNTERSLGGNSLVRVTTTRSLRVKAYGDNRGVRCGDTRTWCGASLRDDEIVCSARIHEGADFGRNDRGLVRFRSVYANKQVGKECISRREAACSGNATVHHAANSVDPLFSYEKGKTERSLEGNLLVRVTTTGSLNCVNSMAVTQTQNVVTHLGGAAHPSNFEG